MEIAARALERENFQREARLQNNRRIVYPPHLAVALDTEPFCNWFGKALQKALSDGEEIENDIQVMALPPSSCAKSYRSMYAFGNHIRCASAEVTMKTIDCGVAATFEQECRSSASDRNIVVANLEYIGKVEEILELDYGSFQVVVLYCNWVVANMVGRTSATMKRDPYGFTLVNFDRLIPFSAQSFAFPLHIEQVFFADDINNPGWKVVLRKEVRGVRVESSKDAMPEIQCLSLGNDTEHAGLQPSTNPNENIRLEPIVEGGVSLTEHDFAAALNVVEEEEFAEPTTDGEEEEEDESS